MAQPKGMNVAKYLNTLDVEGLAALHHDAHYQTRAPGGSLETAAAALEISVDELLALHDLVPQIMKAGRSLGARRYAEAHQTAADFGGAPAGSTVGVRGQ